MGAGSSSKTQIVTEVKEDEVTTGVEKAFVSPAAFTRSSCEVVYDKYESDKVSVLKQAPKGVDPRVFYAEIARDLFEPSPWCKELLSDNHVVCAMQIDENSLKQPWFVVWSVFYAQTTEYLSCVRVNTVKRTIEQVRWRLQVTSGSVTRSRYVLSPTGRTLSLVTGGCSLFCQLPSAKRVFELATALLSTVSSLRWHWRCFQGIAVCRFASDTLLLCSRCAFSERGRADLLTVCDSRSKAIVDFSSDYLFLLDIAAYEMHSLQPIDAALKQFVACGHGLLVLCKVHYRKEANSHLRVFDLKRINAATGIRGVLIGENSELNGKPTRNWDTRFGDYTHTDVNSQRSIISQGCASKYWLLSDKLVVDLPTCNIQWLLPSFSGSFLCGLGVGSRVDIQPKQRGTYERPELSQISLCELPVYNFVEVYRVVLPFFDYIEGVCDICMTYCSISAVVEDSAKRQLLKLPAIAKGIHLQNGLDLVLLMAALPTTEVFGGNKIALTQLSWRQFDDGTQWPKIGNLF